MPRRPPSYEPVTAEPAAPTAEELCADGCVSEEQAAAFCNLCPREVRRHVASGAIPSLKHGKRRLIPKRGLVAWLARKLEAGRQ